MKNFSFSMIALAFFLGFTLCKPKNLEEVKKDSENKNYLRALTVINRLEPGDAIYEEAMKQKEVIMENAFDYYSNSILGKLKKEPSMACTMLKASDEFEYIERIYGKTFPRYVEFIEKNKFPKNLLELSKYERNKSLEEDCKRDEQVADIQLSEGDVKITSLNCKDKRGVDGYIYSSRCAVTVKNFKGKAIENISLCWSFGKENIKPDLEGTHNCEKYSHLRIEPRSSYTIKVNMSFILGYDQYSFAIMDEYGKGNGYTIVK